MSDKEQKPTPAPIRETALPQPSGEIKENSLPTFHNPPPPPPPPPKDSGSTGS